MNSRRQFIRNISVMSGLAMISPGMLRPVHATTDISKEPFGEGELWSLRDGQLSLPVDMLMPESIDAAERKEFLQRHQLGPDRLTPDCNVSLWRQADRVILFDTGGGTQFVDGVGHLPERLAAAGIDPSDVTDVIFTHAHPDHLWGVLDDFDDLSFPEAQYHFPVEEWNYWMDDSTLDQTPDERKSFVVGAQNRLPLLSDRLTLFKGGDEVVPGVEAVSTHGHTPGHTSFALHAGSDSLLVVGDALANAAISFEQPRWASGSDQDMAQGVKTRLSLLDRLVSEQSRLLGFHLPAPGIGSVERRGNAYQFVPFE